MTSNLMMKMMLLETKISNIQQIVIK